MPMWTMRKPRHSSFGSGLSACWGLVCCASVVLSACGGDDTSGSSGEADGAAAQTVTSTQSALVTWHKDIGPLLRDNCVSCHHTGGIAPFSLETYEAAQPFASQLVLAVESGSMPPFLARETDTCKPRLPWADDLRLSAEQKQLLRSWADAGAPEGDASTAPPDGPAYAEPTLEREDVIMRLAEPITVDGNRDIHTCVVADPGFDAGTYVQARLITAGNPRVLHHVVSYLVQPGSLTKAELEATIREQHGVGIGGRYECFGGPGLEGVGIEMLDAWAPGGVPNRAPANSGQPVDPNSLVILDMHYHPTGQPEVDEGTKLSLMTTHEFQQYVSRLVLIGNFGARPSETVFGTGALVKQPDETEAQFLIPAGAKDHVEEMTWTWQLPISIRVFAMGTHMHYVGQDMQITLEHADESARTECLIDTPQWDYNWQRAYAYDGNYDQLPVINSADKLHMRCVYDNTLDNRYVSLALDQQGKDQPVDVPLGEDTLDEMCLGAFGLIYPNLGF